MVNESGSQFLSTIIVLGFAQDTRDPTVYNVLDKSPSTIFVLGFWGVPNGNTQRLWQGCPTVGHPRGCGRGAPRWGTQRLWQRWPTVGHPEAVAGVLPVGALRGCGRGGPRWNTQRLWQGCSQWEHSEAVAEVVHGGTPRGCGRRNQYEKRTAFIKYIYSSSRRRIYKTTTSTTDSFSETEIQCF